MSLNYKDYYAILGIARDAGEDDIKQAFRKLARIHHPDVAKDKKLGEEKFKEINEANEVLSDPEKRKKYDRLGPNGRDPDHGPASPNWQAGGDEQEFHFGGTGFSDFFEQYFSGGTRHGFHQDEGGGPRPRSPAGNPRPQRGSDIEGDILVSLDEAMRGTVRPISLQITNRQTGAAENRTFQVRIPPGATDGRRIRVPEHGEPGHGGGPAGDLFLRVRHAAHPDFTCVGADIFYELDLAPWEAVLGAEIIVPTLDGSIKLRLHAHTESGHKIRVRGRGLPLGKTGERGDFYVVPQVKLPATLNAEERALWEKLRDTSAFRPRATSQTASPQ